MFHPSPPCYPNTSPNWGPHLTGLWRKYGGSSVIPYLLLPRRSHLVWGIRLGFQEVVRYSPWLASAFLPLPFNHSGQNPPLVDVMIPYLRAAYTLSHKGPLSRLHGVLYVPIRPTLSTMWGGWVGAAVGSLVFPFVVISQPHFYYFILLTAAS